MSMRLEFDGMDMITTTLDLPIEVGQQTVPQAPCPFKTQTQHSLWLRRNCEKCAKYDPALPTGCEIDLAMLQSQLGMRDVPVAIRQRMGYSEKLDAYYWDCPEKVRRMSNECDAT